MPVLAATGFQLRICTNKTCKWQGSAQASFGSAAGTLHWPDAAGSAGACAAVWRQRRSRRPAENRRAKHTVGVCQSHLAHLPALALHCAVIIAQVAQFAKDLGLPSVEVQTCGCLGELSERLAARRRSHLRCRGPPVSSHYNHHLPSQDHCNPSQPPLSSSAVLPHPLSAGSCGSGPNMVLLALDGSAPLLLGHVGTPQRMADLLREVCGQQVRQAAGREACRVGLPPVEGAAGAWALAAAVLTPAAVMSSPAVLRLRLAGG